MRGKLPPIPCKPLNTVEIYSLLIHTMPGTWNSTGVTSIIYVSHIIKIIQPRQNVIPCVLLQVLADNEKNPFITEIAQWSHFDLGDVYIMFLYR